MASDDNIVSLGALRFYQQGTTKDAKPEDVLDAARAFVRETGCDHIIICCGRTTEDGAAARDFSKAGNIPITASRDFSMPCRICYGKVVDIYI